MLTRAGVPVLICLTLIPLAGCNSGRVSQENSRLRRENLEQANKIAQQADQLERMQGQIEGLTSKVNSTVSLPGVKASDIPVVTRLQFGRYSGAYDANGDGRDDTIRLYVLTEDQKGRFIPVVGKAVVQIVLIDPDRGVKELSKRVFEPPDWDAAYTSGLTGTHYTLEAKVVGNDFGGPVTAKVTLIDAASNATLHHQMVVE